jgi:hypothetical protein
MTDFIPLLIDIYWIIFITGAIILMPLVIYKAAKLIVKGLKP